MTNWYSVQEQCAGKYRLLFLWWIYRIFGLKGIKIILYPLVFFIVLFSKNGRLNSKKYQKILRTYQKRHKIKITKFSSYHHILSYAFSLAEKMSAICDKTCPLKFEIEKDKNWNSFQDDLKKGIFLISSHLGNIEALSALPQHLPTKSPKVNALMQINQNSIFQQFIHKKAINTHFNLYPAESFGFSEIMSLYEKISQGELILMAGDRTSFQNSKDVLEVKILDRKSFLPNGVFRLAKKMKHPTYAVLLLRTKKGAYKFVLYKLDVSETEQIIAKKYTTFLEKYILKYPDQWYNFFDFFK